ncbi:CAMK/CAMKL protein kinase [Allomyces macrogynus ATCC 38327]|uniref:non-specific serine/threonine protein kinase n=1 Tax=Allomyces macrogynus (strain ATCC 38327) TaxID=578462 RepID=A0A0L0RWF1_ALLM3|nr:CAMK/CAMKL protein kinase [Allomyces macrogynus ATCC 38327]|eukprot:KNE54668.1 CAMK/CAMKL protein kinase [Allomyces macrogynus ATCC 38327]
MDKATDTAQSTRAPKRDKHKDNPNEPSVIGNYKIDRTLGQGTYGKVKLGLHTASGEKVAIKIIEKANIQSQRQVARIQREIRFLKLLHHPHIVKVFEVHETNDQIFIVMEFVQGGELFDYIVSHKRVKEKEARSFYRMMLSALHYCHANAVIHRDLKPENLLLDTDKTIKIIDFGFGNTFKPEGFLDTFCGSPFYAAPGNDSRQAVRGVGVILFALLCGHLPFDDENIKELYKKIASGIFTCPSYLSPSAKHLIQRLITVDPKKRATLDEVLNHAWVNEGYSRPPYSYLPERPVLRDPAALNPDIVNRLQAFGYTPAEIEAAFTEADQSRPHPVRATYFLLSEMLAREEKRLRDSRKPGVPATATANPAAAGAAAGTSSTTSSTTAVGVAATPEHSLSTPASPAKAPPAIVTSPAPDVAKSKQVSTDDSPNTSPTGSTMTVAAPGVNVGASVACSLYSISEDGPSAATPPIATPTGGGTAGRRPAAAANTPISANNKAQFTSMPHVSETPKTRRSSSPGGDAEPAASVAHHAGGDASAAPPRVEVRTGAAARPRHSMNSLQDPPHTAPAAAGAGLFVATQGPPTASPTLGPISAGADRPYMGTTGRTLAAPASPNADGKRRFSLAQLTSGSKRRSSTTPAKAAGESGAGSTVVPGGAAEPQLTLPTDAVASTSSSATAGTPSSPTNGGTLTPGAPGEAREVSSWFLNVNTTSSKSPAEIIAEVKRVLAENKVAAAHDGGFVVECRVMDLVFEIEICKVPRLALFGLHFKRISGGIWNYKRMCNRLLAQMNL